MKYSVKHKLIKRKEGCIMKRCLKFYSLAVNLILLILMIQTTASFAQSGSPLSISYETYPMSKLSNPDTEPVNGQRNFTQDLGIKVNTLNISLAYPVVLSKDRTMLINQVTYQRLDLEYENWDLAQGGKTDVNQAIGISYTAILMHKLSEKWALMGILTPGIASDFEYDHLTKDDFYFSAVAVFIKKYRETLSIGYGIAYVPDFGQPFPIPILAVQWNNGKNKRIECIIPVQFDYTYQHSNNLQLGFHFGMDGNQYHGDKTQYNVLNPQLRYSVGTVGPTLKYRLYKILMLNASAGMTMMRRFEFFDGDDLAGSYDLKSSGFIRFGLSLDME
jgi:hypothetical protein